MDGGDSVWRNTLPADIKWRDGKFDGEGSWDRYPDVVLCNSYSVDWTGIGMAYSFFCLSLPCFFGRCNLYTYAISLVVRSMEPCFTNYLCLYLVML